MIDPMEDSAEKAAMDAAIEALMSKEHGQNVLLTGYVIQAVGVSAEDDRDLLSYTGKTGQSSVTTLGLLAYINANVEEIVWGDLDD